ncbi:MAG TPA: hypothetical protein VIK76_05610, partial [Pyrinomonadaceae bacterium]
MKGLGGVPDAGQRALIGVQIFGKGFREIAQLADEDLEALTNNAKTFGLVMSDEFAAAGDAFGDTLSDMSSLLQGLKNIIGAAVLPVVTDLLGTVRDELVVAFKMFKDTFAPLVSGLGSLTDQTDAYVKSAGFHETILKAIVTAVAYTVKAFAELMRAGADVYGMWQDLRIGGNFLLIMFGKLVEGALWSAQQIANGMAKISFGDMKQSFLRDSNELQGKLNEVRADMKNLGDATTDLLVDKMKNTASIYDFAGKLDTASDSLLNQAKAYKGTASAAEEARPKVKGLADDIDLTGDSAKKAKDKIDEFANTASRQIALLRQAWYAETPAVRENSESVGILLDKYMALRAKVTNPNQLPNDLEGLALAFGKIHPPAINVQKDLDQILNTIPKITLAWVPELRVQQIELERVGEKVFDWNKALVESMNTAEKAREAARKLAVEGLDRLVTSLQQIQQIAPGALGTVASAIGTVVGAAKTAVNAIGDMKAGIKAAKDGESLAALGSIASGIGGIISAAT